MSAAFMSDPGHPVVRSSPGDVLVIDAAGGGVAAARIAAAELGARVHLVDGTAGLERAVVGHTALVLVLATGPQPDLTEIRGAVSAAGAVPVVVLSAAEDAEFAAAARRVGALEVLPGDDVPALADVLRRLAPEPPAQAACRPLPRSLVAERAAWVCIALGAVVLAGWWAGVSAVTTVVPGLPAMKANTALMFVALGAAVVVAARRGPERVTRGLSLVVGVVAAATLFEYVAGHSTGIDTVLADDGQARLPGRPSPHTAAAFVLGAGALVAYSGAAARSRIAAGLLLSFVLVVLLALVGYVYGEQHLRGLSSVTGMAPHTVAGLLVLAVAIPSLRPDRPPVSWLSAPAEAGILYRRLLPAALLVPPLIGGLRILVLGRDPEDVALGTAVIVVSMVAVLVALLSHVMRRLEHAAAQRAQADAELRRSEARYRRLGTLAPSGLQEFDRDGRCTSVNPRWSEITGLSPRQAWDTGWLEALHPGDRFAVTAAIRHTVEQGHELRLEHRVIRPDGSAVWVSARGAAVTDAHDAITGALVSITDVTALKTAQEAAAAQETLLRGLLDHWPGNAIVYRVDDGGIELLNRHGAAAIGVQAHQALGRSLYDILPRSAAESTRARDAEILASGTPLAYEAHLGERSYSATKFVLPDAAGQPQRLAAVGIDVTEHVRLQREFYAAQEDLRHAFEFAPLGIAIARVDTRFTRINAALCELLDYGEEALLASSLSALVHPEEAERFDEDLALLVNGELTVLSTELRVISGAAEAIWVAVRASVVRDATGSPLHLLIQLLDITERRRHEQQLRDLADRDPLTGLANRRSFSRALDQHVHEVARYGPTGALLMLDLDHFKLINDSLGHTVGDEMIVAVARVLTANLRDADVVARLGGDEFAILLPRASRDEAEIVAAKLVAAVRDDAVVRSGPRPRRITASIGITFFDGALRTAEELLVDADLAMYDAKEAGRDQWAHFASDRFAEPRMKARITWVERIQTALEEHRFCLYGQPIVDLTTEKATQFELLLRLIGDDGEAVPPGVFLYIAERYDLVQQIDRWVARQAIGLLTEYPDITVEANVSGKSMDSTELIELVEHDLQRTGVAPHRLVFEITETAAIANVQHARAFAEHLRTLGCRFALDDFGAGFGSFYYLKHLPFDYLKIDGEFVTGCRSSRTDQLVIEAVVAIARGLGKQTIAEFVSDAETQRFLRQRGVDHGQGFHFGRPQPIHDLLAAACETAG